MMEPTLNKSRMAAAIMLLAVILSIPFFWYTTTLIAMQSWEDVLINYFLALFVGEGGAGAILFLIAFFMNGTLPKWFWKTI